MKSPEGFERFLAILDPDRDRAGERYELFRRKLLRFFEWRGAAWPDELADETLDRVVRRLAEGETIRSEDPGAYLHGVARNVLREHWDRQQRRQEAPAEGDLPAASVEDGESGWEAERRVSCLERCLGRLPPETQKQVIGYYTDEKRAKIDARRGMAEALGIGLNALRIRMLRIRTGLEGCVRGCLGAETKAPAGHERAGGGR